MRRRWTSSTASRASATPQLGEDLTDATERESAAKTLANMRSASAPAAETTAEAAEASARAAISHVLLQQQKEQKPPPPPEPPKRRWWQRALSPAPAAEAAQLVAQFPATARALRASHQPGLLRLERSRAQVLLAVQRCAAERSGTKRGAASAGSSWFGVSSAAGLASEAALASPVAALREPGLDERFDPAAWDPETALRLREEGLGRLSERMHARARAAHAEAAVLQDRRLRGERLRSLLERTRCVYQDSQLSVHAPQPAVQELFDSSVCSPHAREGRLLSRWIGLLECQLAGGSPPREPSHAPTPAASRHSGEHSAAAPDDTPAAAAPAAGAQTGAQDGAQGGGAALSRTPSSLPHTPSQVWRLHVSPPHT